MFIDEFTILDTDKTLESEIINIRNKIKFVMSQHILIRSRNGKITNYNIITLHLNYLKEKLIYYVTKANLIKNLR
jgi:hypothetical protein